MPGVFEILSGKVSVSQLRDVQIEDLLRRQPGRNRPARCRGAGEGDDCPGYRRRRVDRAASCAGRSRTPGPRRSSCSATARTASSNRTRAARRTFPDVRCAPVIADIRDAERHAQRSSTRRAPSVVFHAAAHKHVPLMEAQPGRGGQEQRLRHAERRCDVADRVGVERFVLISTDKAVQPDQRHGRDQARGRADRAADRGREHRQPVRGGPLRQRARQPRQRRARCSSSRSRAGGPVTVTHPEMTPLLHDHPRGGAAGAPGRRRWAQAARSSCSTWASRSRSSTWREDLIRLSGLEAGPDIEIVFTGLRPGEKLYEELFTHGEDIARTQNEKIYVVRNGKSGPIQQTRLDELVNAAQAGDGLRLRHLLAEIVPGYNDTPKAASRADGPGRRSGGPGEIKEQVSSVRP